MAAVPEDIGLALRGIGLVAVKVKDDPVNVALHNEFQRLLHLFKNWEASKKEDKRRKALEPEAVAKNAASSLQDKKEAASTKTAKGAREPSVGAFPAAADETSTFLLAGKRSRVTSEAPASQEGVSKQPVEISLTPVKPSTKAPRTKQLMDIWRTPEKQSTNLSPTQSRKSAQNSAEPAVRSSEECVDGAPSFLHDTTATEDLKFSVTETCVETHEEEHMTQRDEHTDTPMAISKSQENDIDHIMENMQPASGGPSSYEQPAAEMSQMECEQPYTAACAIKTDVPTATSSQEGSKRAPTPQPYLTEDAYKSPAACTPLQNSTGLQSVAGGLVSSSREETLVVHTQPAVEPLCCTGWARGEPVQSAQLATVLAAEEVVMTPDIPDVGVATVTHQVASLGLQGPNVSPYVESCDQEQGTGITKEEFNNVQNSPSEVTLSQPTLQVVDNPLQAVTPVAFGSQLRCQATASSVQQNASTARETAPAMHSSRTPRNRRSSVHVTAAAECVRPSKASSFCGRKVSAQRSKLSQPPLLLQATSIHAECPLPQRPPNGDVSALLQTAPASAERCGVVRMTSASGGSPVIMQVQKDSLVPSGHDALNQVHVGAPVSEVTIDNSPGTTGARSAGLQSLAKHLSPFSCLHNAPSPVHGTASLAEASVHSKPLTLRPVAFVCTAKDVPGSAPVSFGPASAGPMWPAHTPVNCVYDEAGSAEEESIPAWSSDGGSPDENNGSLEKDRTCEDQLPFCEERTGTDVVDMFDLEPHETPSPLPEAVWSRMLEQVTECAPEGRQSLPGDTEGRQSTASTPRFCEGDVAGAHDFAQPASRVPSISLPVMNSQQTARSPLAICQQDGPDMAGASQEGFNPLMGTKSQNVEPGAVLSPVEVDQGQLDEKQLAEPEKLASKRSEETPMDTNVESPKGSAMVQKPELGGGNLTNGIGHGTLLAQIRKKMQAEKAAAAEKDVKAMKQPIAALAKAAKAKQEQLKVQEEREARKKALEKERAARQQAPAALMQASVKETRIPTTPIGRKVFQDLKKPQASPIGVQPFIPACKTPSGFPPFPQSTLHNNVNATPRTQPIFRTGLPGIATPRKWRAPTPGPQYPITPEDELEDSEDEEACEAREQKTAKVQAPWAVSDKLKLTVKQQRFTNPEAIFGTFEPTCNLLEIMAPIKSEKEVAKYTIKRRSRNWGNDAITRAEIESFSRKKGYHQM